MNEFGKTFWQDNVRINFDENRRMENLFADGFEIPRIVAGLHLESGKRVDPANTLLIFDEV